jgi:hypothetical protein
MRSGIVWPWWCSMQRNQMSVPNGKYPIAVMLTYLGCIHDTNNGLFLRTVYTFLLFLGPMMFKKIDKGEPRV